MVKRGSHSVLRLTQRPFAFRTAADSMLTVHRGSRVSMAVPLLALLAFLSYSLPKSALWSERESFGTCDQIASVPLSSFCQHAQTVRTAEDIENKFAQCKWSDIPQTVAEYAMTLNKEDWMVKKYANYSQKPVERCTYQNGSSVFVFDRLGILASNSQMWHLYRWGDVAGAHELTRNHKSVHIRLGFTGTMDPSGVIIPYPPLELHHMHVTMGSWTDSLLIQSHTDSQCTTEGGGVGCLPWAWPEEFGMPVTNSLSTVGAVVDVRTKGAPRMDFYTVVAVSLVLDVMPRYPVSFLTFGNPYRAANLLTYGVDSYTHRADRDTVMWLSFELKHTGVFSAMMFHSHWEWTQECSMFMGHPSELGLNPSPWQRAHPWTEIDLSGAGSSIAEFNASVFAHANIGRKSNRHLNTIIPSWEYSSDPYSLGWYPRQDFHVPGFSTRAGDNVTMVCFHHTKDPAFAQGNISMHIGIAGYFVHTEDKQASFEYSYGSVDPSWTWPSFFGGYSREEVFAAGGGPFGVPRSN